MGRRDGRQEGSEVASADDAHRQCHCSNQTSPGVGAGATPSHKGGRV